MDVGIRAVLSGFQEGTKQVAELNKAIEGTADAAKKTEAPLGGSGGNGGMIGNVADLAVGAARLTTAIAGAAAVIATTYTAALYGAIKDTVALGDSLNSLSQKTGIGVEQLSVMKVAAEVNGVAFNAMTTAVDTLNKNISTAARGNNQYSEAFKALGIEVKNTDGTLRTADQTLGDLAEAFSTHKDGTEKSAFAQKLMGQSGLEMIPILNEGRRGLEEMGVIARQTGLYMTAEAAKGAQDITKELKIMQLQMGAVARDLAGPFVSALSEAAQMMNIARQSGAGFWETMQEGAIGFFRVLAFGSEKAQLAKAEKSYMAIVDELASTDFSKPGSARGGSNEDYRASLIAAREKAEADIARLKAFLQMNSPEGLNPGIDKPSLGNVPGRPSTAGGGGTGMVDDTLKMIDAGLRQSMQAMDIEIKAARATHQEKIDLIDEIVRADVGSSQVRIQLLQQRQKAVDDQIKEEMKAQEDAQKQTARLLKADERAFDDYNKVVLDNVREQIAALKGQGLTHDELRGKLQELRAAYDGLGGDTASAVKQIDKELSKIPTNAQVQMLQLKRVMGDAAFDMVNVWSTMFRSMEQEFFEFFKGNQSVGDLIKNVWTSVVDAILAEFARLAARSVMGLIFGEQGAGGSLLGSILGGIGGPIGGALSSALGLGGAGFGGSGGASGGGGGGGLSMLSSLTNLIPGGSPLQSILGSLGLGGGAGVTSVGGMVTSIPTSLGSGFTLGAGGTVGNAAGIGEGFFSGISAAAEGSGAGALAGIGSMAPLAALIPVGMGLMDMFRGNSGSWKLYEFLAPLQVEGVLGGPMGFTGTATQPYRHKQTGKMFDAGEVAAMYLADLARDFPFMVPINFTGSVEDGQLSSVKDRAFDLMRAAVQTEAGGRLESGGWNRLLFPSESDAVGTDTIVTSPRSILVGEIPERVTVSPLGGAAHRRGGMGGEGLTLNVNGFSMMDNYSANRMAQELRRLLA